VDSGASPAVVLEHARVQVGELDNRIVTGFSDADLVDGLAAVQVLKGQLSDHLRCRGDPALKPGSARPG
jgi:hypothetical protein